MKSYFRQAVDGDLGEAIQQMYAKKLVEFIKKVKDYAIIEDDGAILWISNKHYLPDDCCEMLDYAGYPFSWEKTTEKRNIQTAKEIEEYINRDYQFSEEDLQEMRNEFGEGAVIVDAISGKHIQL